MKTAIGLVLACAVALAGCGPKEASPQAPAGYITPPVITAGPGPGSETGVFTDQPRFIVEAVNYKVLDETDWDFWFSDEVFAIFEAGGYIAGTDEASYVDNGDVIAFRFDQKCVLPIGATHIYYWPCAPKGAPGPLHFTISLYEADWSIRIGCSRFTGAYPTGTTTPRIKACDQDDLIGRKSVTLQENELVAAMPQPGDTLNGVMTLNSDGKYEVRYRITRLANVRIQPPVLGADPVTEPPTER